MTLGEKLKKLRVENNLTQDELAQKLYVTRTAVSKWERDKGYPNIESLKLISSIFNVNLDELFSDFSIDQNANAKPKSYKSYYLAVAFFIMTVVFAVLRVIFYIWWFSIISVSSAVGYISFALLFKTEYRVIKTQKDFIKHVISRVLITIVFILVIVGFFV